MDKKLKAKWVKALRSGKYRQGSGRLKNKRGDYVSYCCLGVLREICPAIGEGKINQNGHLPLDSAKKYGLRWSQQLQLSRRNDGAFGQKKHTFSEIADYIKKHL